MSPPRQHLCRLCSPLPPLLLGFSSIHRMTDVFQPQIHAPLTCLSQPTACKSLIFQTSILWIHNSVCPCVSTHDPSSGSFLHTSHICVHIGIYETCTHIYIYLHAYINTYHILTCMCTHIHIYAYT